MTFVSFVIGAVLGFTLGVALMCVMSLSSWMDDELDSWEQRKK